MSEVHRGRSKQGMKQKTIYLTPHESDALKTIAEENCRTISGQIVWLIQQSIKEANDESR